jgi:ABC-2 type transport system permease protein
MSTMAVAKKDFKDGIRSWVLIGLTVLFALLIAGSTYFFTNIQPPATGPNSGNAEQFRLLSSLILPTYILMPIVGTIIGYKAIVGERTSGSLKFLLGLPHTRRDVVFGKLLGRSGIITVAILIGFTIGGIVLYASSSAFALGEFLFFIAVTILLGVTFVSISIAFSSMTKSSSIAIGGAITLVLLFLFLWSVLMLLVRYAADQLSLMPSEGIPNWLLFLQSLNPTAAYQDAVRVLVEPSSEAVRTAMQNQPFYLQDWFGFVILAFWLVVPISLAYIRFERADL